jgi:hypothetical protein
MGEVVVSSDEELEMRAESETEKEEEMGETESETEKKKENNRKRKKGGRSSGRVRWDRFLKRMNLRVLLVEADDCTRQIIAALLRKCSYRGQYICLLACFTGFVGFCSFFCRIVNWVRVGFGFCGKLLDLKSTSKGLDRGRQ